MGVPENGWFISQGKSQSKMDDDLGYLHLWKPPYLEYHTNASTVAPGTCIKMRESPKTGLQGMLQRQYQCLLLRHLDCPFGVLQSGMAMIFLRLYPNSWG